jgi:hypothetical protein
MIKFSSITFTVLLMAWIRMGLQSHVNLNAPENAIVCAGTALWVLVFGSFIGWKLLLIMVRQLGNAVRGQ